MGELMKVSGFGALQGLGRLRPEDYRTYLEVLSEQNKRVKKPQFHAMISAKGRSHNKQQLTKIAEQWLKSMGYVNQPYLIVFHKDTDNNHVHIVTTRVDREGKKISSAFEKRRAVSALNRIMELDPKHVAQLDAAKALAYRCSTKAQFLLVLENFGYDVREKEGQINLYKFGSKQFAFEADRLKLSEPDAKRAKQLKAIFQKYATVYDAKPEKEEINLAGGRVKESTVYHSELGDFLKEKFGIELVFHALGDKPPYGYSIIDHAREQVFKGSEVMRLKEMTEGITRAEPAEAPAHESYTPAIRFYFTDDVDDEQIKGPTRRRKRNARTNTR